MSTPRVEPSGIARKIVRLEGKLYQVLQVRASPFYMNVATLRFPDAIISGSLG